VDLATQVNQLIANAPDDPATIAAVEAIAPILLEEAQRYQQTMYYVLQTEDGQWQIITLEERHPPYHQKVVIHAYGSAEMANAHSEGDRQLIVVEMPIIPLLFQLLAADPVDSLIVLEPPNGEQGWEVSRESLLAQVRSTLSLPPNIA